MEREGEFHTEVVMKIFSGFIPLCMTPPLSCKNAKAVQIFWTSIFIYSVISTG
jgi:hypothetical protein